MVIFYGQADYPATLPLMQQSSQINRLCEELSGRSFFLMFSEVRTIFFRSQKKAAFPGGFFPPSIQYSEEIRHGA